MTRLMYDSTNGFDIPASAGMVAGYLDGSYAWTASEWARFPNAVKVKIAVSRYIRGAHVYDVETGDFSPAQCCDAIQIARGNGENPSAYVNLFNWPLVQAEFRARGLVQPPYWVAWYNGVASIPAGAIAKQYANDAAGTNHYSGGHFDLSVVADFWPGVDSAYGPGGGTIGGTFMALSDAEQTELLAGVRDLNLGWLYGTGTPNPANNFSQLVDAKLRALIAEELAKLPAGGATEPAEPRTVTLDIPAQKISGSLT